MYRMSGQHSLNGWRTNPFLESTQDGLFHGCCLFWGNPKGRFSGVITVVRKYLFIIALCLENRIEKIKNVLMIVAWFGFSTEVQPEVSLGSCEWTLSWKYLTQPSKEGFLMEMESDSDERISSHCRVISSQSGKWPVRKSSWHKKPGQQLADNPCEEWLSF